MFNANITACCYFYKYFFEKGLFEKRYSEKDLFYPQKGKKKKALFYFCNLQAN
jgi:hypothetical protein